MSIDDERGSVPGGGPKGPVKDALRAPLPRRFYETVKLREVMRGDAAAFEILLDGRCVRTPAKQSLVIPYRDFAERIAGEWRAQRDVVDPALMPATRLANSALDCVEHSHAAVRADIVAYAGSDLICYRAEGPSGLVARQQEQWDPILSRVEAHLGARFVCVRGLVHQGQPDRALQRVSEAVSGLDTFTLAGVSLVTALTGSALLALAGLEGLATRPQIWHAAHVDEDWQIGQWGEDGEAAARRASRQRDFDAAAAVMKMREQ